MEHWLKADVPSDFELIQSESSLAPGEELNTVVIDFTPDPYRRLLKSLASSHADSLRLEGAIDLQGDPDGAEDAFFLLSVQDSTQQMIRLQYGDQ
ncbi:hypothetical protein CRI93_14810 [Longimonas halophila]|uniref:Uncharacterized protein n=1 Tax=Longimonas halophila TaxID=1469170 RepID=A0A2H3NTR8_9BACT|nr:hypothetical protein CRI93_14810 [Longimonas halophila]